MNAAERLILEHQSFLRALAGNIASTLPHHVDFDELVSLGQAGPTEAARSREPGRGVLFTTFANDRVRGIVFDGLRKMTWLPPAARRCIKEQSGAVERLGAVFLISGLGECDGQPNPTDRRATPADAESKEMHARFLGAMSRLPDDMSMLLWMRSIEHRSMADVGVLMGRNKLTACRRHAEAIDLLRTMIEPPSPGRPAPRAAGRPLRREPA